MAFSQSNSRGNLHNEYMQYFFFFLLLYYIRLYTLIVVIELQNRKILEELQLKKQMLLKQGVAPTLNSSLGVSSTGSASNVVSIFCRYLI